MSSLAVVDQESSTEKLANAAASSSSTSSSVFNAALDPESFVPAEEPATQDYAEGELHRTNTTNTMDPVAESLSDFNRTISRVLTNMEGIEADTLKEKDTPLPFGMGLDKPFPPDLPPKEQYAVSFDGPDDPIHPHNWPMKKKIFFCFILGLNTFTVALSSLIFSPAVEILLYKYKVNVTVTTLGVSLYVLGFASGPVVYAPLSELYGRKPIILISLFMFICFSFATLTSETLEGILLCRFFGSFTGSAALVVVPAAFSDVFNNKQRGNAINIFSMCVFLAPLLAPIVGLFIAKSYLGWRWTEYIIGILAALSFVMMILFYEESHHPIILVNKARELRRRTGNWGIYAPLEELSLTFKEIAEKNITRPLKLLFTESIILLITIYNAFIYGILYLFLTAYPVVFQQGYGMASGVAELPYIGLIVGMLFGGLFCIYTERSYKTKLLANNNIPLPEARLPPMIVGSFAFPIGILWFFWTGNYPDKVHWIVPSISGIFSGFGLMTIFIPSLNYIVDSYLIFAASAVAANTFLRSAFGAAFPLFARYMFSGMGINWAGLLIGLVGVALIPVPILFYIYGKRIREKSKYAFVLDGK